MANPIPPWLIRHCTEDREPHAFGFYLDSFIHSFTPLLPPSQYYLNCAPEERVFYSSASELTVEVYIGEGNGDIRVVFYEGISLLHSL